MSHELAGWLFLCVFLAMPFLPPGSKIPSFLMCFLKHLLGYLLHHVPIFLLQNSLLRMYVQLRNLSLDLGNGGFPSLCQFELETSNRQ